ncbi:hypothetical protein F1C16_22495 (plasmid) [Hymenobacter sp. NBH84]|uniref:hypothetical protein n=1 Tax=Hymenobacter sp. NBH84 TaxID=2596915 RepID=UPI001624BD1A|nr:hypothetical protein [Hymenobacter sp. NBH84]QNE42390.1 hypothetical protein F1C16_22495 [Hymenobacter sp. NBH84]
MLLFAAGRPRPLLHPAGLAAAGGHLQHVRGRCQRHAHRPDAGLPQPGRPAHGPATGPARHPLPPAVSHHRRSWLGQEAGQFQFYYQADGFDAYFRVTAQRLGDGLLVIFSDTQDEDCSHAEEALRAT